jgi:hypothetical protein
MEAVRPRHGRATPQAEDPAPLAAGPLCRQASEVEARCGSAARRVLCRGRGVTRVPTAKCAGKTGKVLEVQVLCDEGVAIHIGPRAVRRRSRGRRRSVGRGVRRLGQRAAKQMSSWVSTLSRKGEDNTAHRASASGVPARRGPETPCMRIRTLPGNREIWWLPEAPRLCGPGVAPGSPVGRSRR